MKFIYKEGPPVTIDEACGQPPGTFAKYMLAKEVMFRIFETQYPFAQKKVVELNAEEVAALLDVIPELRKFHRASSV